MTREMLLERVGGKEPRCYIADHFALFCDPQPLARFLMRYELMTRILNVHGSIIECGVKNGVGMMQWHHLSRLLEPLARRRLVYGFDTFDGFPSVSDKDGKAAKAGDCRASTISDKGQGPISLLAFSIGMNQANNIMVHHDESDMLSPKEMHPRHRWQQVLPIVGDFMETSDEFLRDTPHLVAALLYLDFDLYEPTKKAIELFVPRMPKGAIIAFDELDHLDWPGETLALVETLGVGKLRLQRFAWEPTVSYAVIE